MTPAFAQRAKRQRKLKLEHAGRENLNLKHTFFLEAANSQVETWAARGRVILPHSQ
jgi:hypothetical protein